MFTHCGNCPTPTGCNNTRVCFSLTGDPMRYASLADTRAMPLRAHPRGALKCIGRAFERSQPSEQETLYRVSPVVINVSSIVDGMTIEGYAKLKRAIAEAGMLAMSQGKHPADMDPIERFALVLGRGIRMRFSPDPAGIRIETMNPCAVVCRGREISVREFPQSQRS